MLPVSVHAGDKGTPQRLIYSVDGTNTGEMTNEVGRVLGVEAAQCSTLVDALGSVREVEVQRWASAEEVWAGGEVFRLPTVAPGEGEWRLPIFTRAIEQREEAALALIRPERAGCFGRIARALRAGRHHPVRESCPEEAIARGLERGLGELTIVTSDLEPYRCDAHHTVERHGGRVVVIQVPQRDGVATRERMLERRARVRARFPDILIVESADIVDGSSFTRLADMVRGQQRGGQP
jgi:hypothetical protein